MYLYSAMHTGTWFLIDLLQSAYSTRELGAAELMKRSGKEAPGELDFKEDEPVGKRWVDENVRPYITFREKKIKNIILHFHRFVDPNKDYGLSPMLESLYKIKPEVPVLIPMRDPLLANITRLERVQGLFSYSKEEREELAKVTSTACSQLIGIPEDHRFVFPIDIKLSEAEKRDLCLSAIKHAGLRKTTRTDMYIKQWKPVNVSAEVAKDRDWGDISKYEEAKRLIKANDIVSAKEIIGPEIEVFSQNEELKKRLEALGYKDLAWW